ncbi:MAG TPA: ABC transporter permease [Thermoleophilaceae bacterium]|jgi:hypothetical protein
MTRLVSAELLKLRTTRTALGFLAAITLLTLGLQAIGYATLDAFDEADLKQMLSGAGAVTALLLVLGIVATTGEYRHNTITSTVLVTPDRRRIVVSKLGAYVLTGAFLGLVAMAVSLAAGIPWLSARDISLDALDTGDYAGLVVGGMYAAALAGGIGVAIGTIVRNQVAAVVGTLIYLFVVEPALTLIDDEVYGYTIGGGLGAVSADTGDNLLDPVPGGLILLAWMVVLGAIGAALEQRRDVV